MELVERNPQVDLESDRAGVELAAEGDELAAEGLLAVELKNANLVKANHKQQQYSWQQNQQQRP